MKLHGRPRSNYYNAVKAVLIEKNIDFEEVLEPLPPRPEFLSLSPMAKIPCLVTDRGPLTETATILDYLEDQYTDVPMLPTDPFDRAKVRELCKSLELYIEWVARRGYGALRGETVSDHDKAAIKSGLAQSIEALNTRVSFSPWIAGDTFTYADIFGYFMLFYARHSAKANANLDLLAEITDCAPWFDRVSERPSMQRVLADAEAYAKAQS